MLTLLVRTTTSTGFMKLLSIIFAIDFVKSQNLVLEKNKADFLKFLSQGSFDTNKLPQLGLDINDEKTRTKVILNEEKIAIAVEHDNIENAKQRLTEVLTYIYDHYSYSEKIISRIGLRTQWQEEWPSSFTKLVTKYKEIFYKKNIIVDSSIDVAVNLTLSDGSYRVNFVTGPMKKDQGEGLLIFKDRQLHHDFVFVDLDRMATSHKNDLDNIVDFSEKSITYEIMKAKEVMFLFQQK